MRSEPKGPRARQVLCPGRRRLQGVADTRTAPEQAHAAAATHDEARRAAAPLLEVCATCPITVSCREWARIDGYAGIATGPAWRDGEQPPPALGFVAGTLLLVPGVGVIGARGCLPMFSRPGRSLPAQCPGWARRPADTPANVLAAGPNHPAWRTGHVYAGTGFAAVGVWINGKPRPPHCILSRGSSRRRLAS